jgi:hypothetical protein
MKTINDYQALKEANPNLTYKANGAEVFTIYTDVTGLKSTCATGCDFYSILNKLDLLLKYSLTPITEMLQLKEHYKTQAFNFPSLGIVKMGSELSQGEMQLIQKSHPDRLVYFEPATTEPELVTVFTLPDNQPQPTESNGKTKRTRTRKA